MTDTQKLIAERISRYVIMHGKLPTDAQIRKLERSLKRR